MRFIWYAITLLLIGIFVNPLGNALPRRWFHPDRFPYRAYAWEQEGRIYRKLLIHKWKDKVPDMSRVNPFMVSKRLDALPSSKQVDSLVQETCVAEFIHLVLMLLSPLILCAQRAWATPLMLMYIVVFNLPFALIQRYNRPQLMKLAQKLRLREERLYR